jgi:hypothetical protein
MSAKAENLLRSLLNAADYSMRYLLKGRKAKSQPKSVSFYVEAYPCRSILEA